MPTRATSLPPTLGSSAAATSMLPLRPAPSSSTAATIATSTREAFSSAREASPAAHETHSSVPGTPASTSTPTGPAARGQKVSEHCLYCKKYSGPSIAGVLTPEVLLQARTNCRYNCRSRRTSSGQETHGNSVTKPIRSSKQITRIRKTGANANRAQWYRRVAKLHRELAEAFEEATKNEEEIGNN
ncbi:MAG: hypothetical protein M1839_009538 [Geoglossum umbratile]|nr:MAG: hypothetical protein M1839_009538 [Geoglossum umbratile]